MSLNIPGARLACATLVVALVAACAGADERKLDYLHKGEAYFAAQNYDKARVEVRNALQIDPKFAAARYLAGRIAERTDNIRDALGNYRAAVDEDPRFAAARAALGRLLLLAGATDQARDLVAAGLKLTPDDPGLLVVRAGLEARADDLQLALADAQRAQQLAPNDEYAVSMLASLFKREGRLAEAEAVVRAAVQAQPRSIDLHVVLADLATAHQDYDVVREQLEAVIAIEPRSLAHRARLAQFFLFRKDVAAAEAVWRRAINELPEQSEPRLALVDLLWTQHDEATARRELHTQLLADPSNQTLKLDFASFMQQKGQLDDAERMFQQIIKQSGKNATGLSARTRLAALYLTKLVDSGPARAATLVGEVLQENPRDNDALILRADMALKRGDAATAITDLRAVLRDQPNSLPLQRALARAHLQNHDATLAEETLRNALQIDPADADTRKDLVQLLLRAGKGEQAKALLDPLVSVAGFADDPQVIEARFRAQLLTHDAAGALQTAQRVQQMQPKSATGWYFEGLAAEAKHDLPAARKGYEAALVRQPEALEPLAALVRLDLAEGQGARAQQRVSQVLAANPGNFAAYNMRGELQLAAHRWSEAIAAFGRCAELAPRWWAPYRGLAAAYLGAGQREQAIASYRRGIDATSNAALRLDLAALYERLNQPDDAVQVYRQWLQLEPGSLEAANNLAMLLVSHRSDKVSLGEAAKWAELLRNSSQPELLDTRGWVKFKSGDYQGAVALLRQAADAAPHAGVVHYHLGMAQWKAGDLAGARDNLQAATGSKEAFTGIDEARQALAALGHSG